MRSAYVKIYKAKVNVWRGGEAVTQGSAKPPCAGSIPARASRYGKITFWIGSSLVERFTDNEEVDGPIPSRSTFLDRAVAPRISILLIMPEQSGEININPQIPNNLKTSIPKSSVVGNKNNDAPNVNSETGREEKLKKILTNIFKRTIKIDSAIHNVFLSDKPYPTKTNEFSQLLSKMEKNLLTLGTIKAGEFEKISERHKQLYNLFSLSKDYGEIERRNIYEKHVFNLEPIESFSDDLIPWVLDAKIDWDKIESMNTIWTILHQKMLMDEELADKIGETSSKKIHGYERKFIVVGQNDEYVKNAIKNFEEIGKGSYSTIIIVNENQGKFALNIRDLEYGHSGIVNVNHKDNEITWRLWLYKEEDAKKEAEKFKNNGFGNTISDGHYVRGGTGIVGFRKILELIA